MEREFSINIAEEPPGRVCLCWDDLRLTARAQSPLRGEGLCKLWLLGPSGKILLGTMAPERGRLTLCRQLSLHEVKRVGAWPPEGVEAALIWPFDPRRPFPRTDLFCFGLVEGERLMICFDREGMPRMPEQKQEVLHKKGYTERENAGIISEINLP